MKTGAWILSPAALVLSACNLATRGEKIAAYGEPRRALRVLDVQKDFTAEGARMPVDKAQADRMIRNINAVAGMTSPTSSAISRQSRARRGSPLTID